MARFLNGARPRTGSDASPAADARFGARALVAGLALALVAVPFGLLLFLVEDKWRPLLRVDDAARDDLHAFAVAHAGFVSAMKALEVIGSSFVYFPLFIAVAAWLLWRGPRPPGALVVL